MKIRRRIAIDGLAVLLFFIALGAAASAGEADFSAVGGGHELKGAPGIYESNFAASVGDSPFDKIGLHRVAKVPHVPGDLNAVVLYLPGTNMNGEVALEDPRYSFQVYLAEQGVDVWAMDYRTHFIPPQTPQSDLSELAGWTNDLFESDIDAAAKFVSEKSGRDKLFVAGFSRGVEFAYLYAARHPGHVAGIIALDGFIPTHPMRAQPVTVGHYADDVGGEHLTYDKRYKLMQMVIDNPDQPAPIPKYKTARENLEHVVYGAGGFFGGNGGLANPQGGFSDAVVLARLLIGYDRYWPAVQDGENPFTPELFAALKASKIPVIAFASTNFGSQWPGQVEAAAKSTGAPDPSFTKFDNWGHLDVLAGTKSESEVFAPTAAWIKQHEK
jgi:pimeloyl-ACP methyl ester carboxylesterase